VTASAVGVLVALGGAPEEQPLVAALDRPDSGATVVRRCVDLADLLAAASTRTASVAVLAADLRRLDGEAVARLSSCGVCVVAVVSDGDDESARRMRRLGAADVVADSTPLDVVVSAVVTAASRGNHDPLAELEAELQTHETDVLGSQSGLVVAVWGPTGAPGRTTVAVTLAVEAARLGVESLLIDADTYGASVAQVLGLLDEAPGLAAAARAANSGRLDRSALCDVARTVTPGLRVLTGFTRPERWPELRPSALRVVLEQARGLVQLTIVDVAFCLEGGDASDALLDGSSLRRNAAALATLDESDVVLAVGSADPVGLQRLLRMLPEVRGLTAGDVRVVLNRVRRTSTGAHSHQPLTDVVVRHSGLVPVAYLPEDRAACDLALASGRSLFEVAPKSALRKAIVRLARDVALHPEPALTPLR
jgi:MinD-like ATPase involved in chromosome partitioning or flagellar assembly